MNDYILLFKTLYKNQSALGKDPNKKRKLPQSAVMVLSMAPIVVMISVGLVFFGMYMKSTAELSAVVTALMSATQVFMIFTGLASVINTLYNSEDGAFLSSLPVKPASVFLAKFSLIYIGFLEMAAIFLIPTALSLTIAYAAVGNSFFYGFYPLLFLIILLTPMLPMFIITLFSMPLAWLGSFLKGRSTLKSVMLIIFYVVLMCGYFAVIFWFNTSSMMADGAVMDSVTFNALNTFATVMYTNKSLIELCLGINAGINSAIAICSHVAMIALSILLSSLFYRRITAKQLESKPETSRRAVSYRQNSIVKSLVIKDFKSIMRNPSMAMGAFANIIITPVIIVLMYQINDIDSMYMTSLGSTLVPLGFTLMYAFIFLGSSNQLSLQSFTREGESFFITKTLPVDAASAIKAKLVVANSIPFACIAIIMILCMSVFKIDFVNTLFAGISIAVFVVGMNALNIFLDIKYGNVNWKTASDLRNSNQNNTRALGPILISLLPSILLLILSYVFADVNFGLSDVVIYVIYWAVAIVSGIIFNVVGFYLLFGKGIELFDKIGENDNAKSKRRAVYHSAGRGGGFGGKDGMLG